ncbi:glycosyl hydrolase [Clostridium cellulovorans]|uniref:Dockerin type 1 n=2 Tax=Clostridium cellulovorans TaxID=1493 RepID=D9SQV8_CLOC7|nr:glycosyl hydrolase [Clostridium cellulovorans]ADL52314.1 Dockerin type 1 [Clostridium cellulovorans 743B]BAV13041.1 mannanase [Clostridium cellulovorans]
MKKIFGRAMSLLATFALVCSFFVAMPTTPVKAETSLPVKVEAEACTLSNGAAVTTNVYGTNYPGYSGNGFVWASNSGTITFNVTVPKNGMYEISSRCWMYLGNVGDTRLQVLSINGAAQGNFYVPNKGGWADYSFGYFYLEAGTAKIEIGSSGSWGFILYDTVTFDNAKMPALKADPTPCDVNATSETKNLKQYLTSVYGNHVISGQQEIYGGGNDGNAELEFDYIYNKTGKYPAIRGFDFMNYNPLYGWEDGTTNRMIKWVKERGGIATASWHINVPSDFTNYKLGDKLDWKSCTYKPTASFKTANCLDKTSKEYAYLMLAVDDLAKQLLILQDAKVPVLLRPFHEAEGNNNTNGSGAWFWWGSGGADVYKQLWKLLYSTLTEKYGIHNVIWEVNLYSYANSAQWYPGDDCVDIVGYDKYEGSPYTWKTSAATSVFLTLVNHTNDTKMVALTENDVIPDIQNIVNQGAWWLYFCPWYGDFITSSTYNDPVLLKTTYNSPYVVTLDELPKDLYASSSKVQAPTLSVKEGTYSVTQTVALSSATEGATIYYTLDGTEPTVASTVYDKPIEVAKTTTIKAIAIKAGLTNSDVVTATYTISVSMLGDVNNDGKVNAIDYAMVKSYLLGNPVTINLKNADLNSDGKINAIDLASIKKILLS